MEDKIKASLCRAVSSLPKPNFDIISATPITQMKKHDSITRQTFMSSSTIIKISAYTSVAAAIFFICCYTYIFQYASAVSFINYSVNPSFSLSVTRAQTVLEIIPKNKSAEDFLAEHTYIGLNIDEALQALTYAMVEDGYLTDKNNAVNIQVTGENSQAIEQLIFNSINMVIKEKGLDANINILPCTELSNFEQQAFDETNSQLESIDSESNKNLPNHGNLDSSVDSSKTNEDDDILTDVEDKLREESEEAADAIADAEDKLRDESEAAADAIADAEDKLRDESEAAADAEEQAREESEDN